jgi:replicative DNA helicase
MKYVEKIFGLVLLADKNLQAEIISSIDENWLVTDFQQEMYQAVNKCLLSKEDIDIVSVSTIMKTLPGYTSDYVYKLSVISSEANHVELMHWRKFIAEAHREYVIRVMGRLSLTLSQQVQNVGTLNDFENVLQTSLSEIAFKHVKTDSNVSTIDSVVKRHEMAKEGILSGIRLPYSEFYRVVLLESVDLMVVGARPAMGKTAFVVSTAVKMAVRGDKVLVFALEMSKEQMMRRVISNLASVDSNRIKYGECNDTELVKINALKTYDKINNITLVEGSQTIDSIARLISLNKPDIVFVDYLQKVKGNSKDDMYTSVTKVSNGLKEISQNMHVPIIAMAQLSRPDSSKAGRRPTLPDLRQSGEIEQDASIVAFLHRPEYYGESMLEDGSSALGVCEVIIAKNREGDTGVYSMAVDLKTSEFKPINKNYNFASKPSEDEEAPF